jgi:putative colanic acid biosynthesis acetyltransferase WcaF
MYTSELSLQNKIGRFLWGVVFCTLYRMAPRPCHGWRRFWLRRFGAKLESPCAIYASARIWAPWHLTMRAGSVLGDRVDCYNVAPILLEKGAVVSQDACLCAATHDFRSESFDLKPAPISVGEKAWVAARAFVGPGVSVGAHAVVGACAVVMRDVPESVVMVGNPAVERSKI